MTLLSNVKWKKNQKGLPRNWFKGMWFLDQVYVIRKPEVFNGWICHVIELDHGSSPSFNKTHPLLRTSDGEFIYDFDGNNPHYQVEYLGKL